jgi:glycosyltransferase involved in cell wall biosynthesis
MKIVFEHNGILPVLKYGGTERIIYWLMKELVKLGHQVTLIGSAESQVQSIGVKLIPRIDHEWTKLIPKDTDLVHTFYSHEGIEFPHLVTIEGNGQPGETFSENTVFVSRKHAEIHGSDQFVYNGIDLDEYPFIRTPRKSFQQFLFLAKARWKVKNLKDCVRACKKNHKHLHIAGGREWTLSRYIHSYGMVEQSKKLPLMNQMDGLLWPVRWHEPFGIAVIEAFSQGLPVFSSGHGSLKELVTPECGIVCETYEEFEQALSGSENPFDARAIRNRLEQEFSTIVMTQKYLQYYEKILSGEALHKKRPAVISPRSPEELLPF